MLIQTNIAGREAVEIVDDENTSRGVVLYDPETRTLRVTSLAPGAKRIRVWSPKEKDFRTAAMMDDERTVDVRWTKDS